jgi:hypothetical protein
LSRRSSGGRAGLVALACREEAIPSAVSTDRRRALAHAFDPYAARACDSSSSSSSAAIDISDSMER